MADSVGLNALIRRRGMRIVLGFALLGASAWAFAPYLAYRVATSAFVNAELVRVTAPIAGRLTGELPHKGDVISRTTSTALIKSLSPDRRQLLDLARQQDTAEKKGALAGRQLQEVNEIDSELSRRITAFHEASIGRLGYEIEEADAERKGCLAEVGQRRDVGARMEELVRRGTASKIRASEVLALQEAAITKCEMAQARLRRLQAELTLLRGGVYVRDAVNDVPYSQQQRDRMILRRQELESEVLQERSRAIQLTAQMEDESNRVERLAQYELAMPINHVVWSAWASAGSAVTEGQTVLDLANCAQRFIAVELPEREFEQIKAGDPASVRLVGSSDWKQGQVRQVRGSAARADDRLLAADVPGPTQGKISVEVRIAEDDRRSEQNSFCNIGRLAEVRFQRTHLVFLDRISQHVAALWTRLTGPAPVAVVAVP
ncbi:MAG: HlyD family efflux transporter periplasmic adaptor subunit [Hyphomicrobiaceae bacterium]|nr:HlyD family efflux transporter periplasmic adaptor subunit [Hyphomicrobiaceae bacterium]